ncbi:MAG TPA: four-helix bundle copper-binding protein [Gaiellaceae bacterium]|jgi:hypothetical protein
MSIDAMMDTHPLAGGADLSGAVRVIEDCLQCLATCTACADACLAEDDPGGLVSCIRLNLDCADVCAATARVLARRTAQSREVLGALVAACAEACRACAEECERHASHHAHCEVCARACRRCAESCEELASALD